MAWLKIYNCFMQTTIFYILILRVVTVESLALIVDLYKDLIVILELNDSTEKLVYNGTRL